MLNITNITRVFWVALAVMATMTSPGTSAQSATDAGSLEAGLAAEERGDWKAALLLLEPLAEQGNPRAQDRLGYMYDFGEGVPHDDAQVVKWYRRAAEQGNADAQYRLAYMYDNGEGVPHDDAEAMKWYRKAAEQGNADAQENFARLSAAEKEQREAKEAADKLAKKIAVLLPKRKDIGDTVCYPSSCTVSPALVSSCVVYGQVDEVHNDKIKVIVHADSDRSIWISYNEVIGCDSR
jgi:uncharacterized protein